MNKGVSISCKLMNLQIVVAWNENIIQSSLLLYFICRKEHVFDSPMLYPMPATRLRHQSRWQDNHGGQWCQQTFKMKMKFPQSNIQCLGLTWE